MKKSLLLLCILFSCLSASAGDILKIKVVNSATRRPVSDVTLTVEYPDTLVTYVTDHKGRLKFKPSSFPFTMTARAEGMLEATFGYMSMPASAEAIELAPDPSAPVPVGKRRADWSSDRPRRLSSTFIVRTPASKSR